MRVLVCVGVSGRVGACIVLACADLVSVKGWVWHGQQGQVKLKDMVWLS
jgi:hypothetical protein